MVKLDDDFMDYPLWERLLEEDIQGIFNRRLEEQLPATLTTEFMYHVYQWGEQPLAGYFTKKFIRNLQETYKKQIILMEKIMYIILEILAILLSLSMIYHYFVNHCDGMVIIFSGVFAWAAFWCHVIQKNTKFKMW